VSVRKSENGFASSKARFRSFTVAAFGDGMRDSGSVCWTAGAVLACRMIVVGVIRRARFRARDNALDPDVVAIVD